VSLLLLFFGSLNSYLLETSTPERFNMKITESRLRQIIREEVQDKDILRKMKKVQLMNGVEPVLHAASTADTRAEGLKLFDLARRRLENVATMDQNDGLPADPALAKLIANLGRIAKDAQILDVGLTINAVGVFLNDLRNYISGLEKKP
jgi:hypothetical protein